MKLNLAIALTLTSLVSLTSSGWAQPTITTASTRSTIQFVPPPPPDLPPVSGRITGGASRGQCPDVRQPLTALVPTSPGNSSLRNGDSQIVWGLTTAAHPTLWFYVPYELTSEVPLEFVLLDDQDNPVYQTSLTSAVNSPGIASVTLPNTAPPLEMGKMYQWYFLVYCGGESPVFAQGSIQRTTLPNTATQIDQLPLRDQANLYATNGIWFDALTAVATLHRDEPDNGTIAADWAALLQSIDLSNLAQQPFVACCTPQAD